MKQNKIVLDIPNDRIIVADKHVISYSDTQRDPPLLHINKTYLLRSPAKQVLFPGDAIELPVPEDIDKDVELAIEPRYDDQRSNWLTPSIITAVNGTIQLANVTDDIVAVGKHQHLAQVRYTCDPNDISDRYSDIKVHNAVSNNVNANQSCANRLALISIDPDNQLLPSEKEAFSTLHQCYQKPFESTIGRYNDQLGKVRAYINIGNVEPPPQKARIPAYRRENMDLLQSKMDELESQGVLARPEDLDIKVEHVSPSFLVKKPGGGHRMVTAFTNISTYTKPIPSKITSTSDVLQFLAQWRFILKSDMSSQFFQLPMCKDSLKYLGVVTPYKGIMVYTRAAMGMPGSTECLDQLMFRILGNLIYEGVVMKIADDLYVGGNDVQSLLYNWERVLQLFEQTNLRLSPAKTVICPVNTTVLGWIWSAGSISVSPHKINPLTQCSLPTTVKGLRAWCGAAKHIKACIPHYSSILADLETATAGKESRDRIQWTPDLETAFKNAQQALSCPKTVVIPQRSDQLIITNDGAVRNGGLGSVLYILRKGKMLLGGYYSMKLKSHHINWLPCEIEALAIGSSLNHWSHYVLQSHQQTQILTDSRPCVQALARLSRGEYSTSARVSTFLSTLSRYNVKLQHIAGTQNLPADYLSRSPMECTLKSCQICKFIADTEQSVIMSVTVSDILTGKYQMPFTNTVSWKRTQQDCPALRRAFAHLSQGTRPGKKATNIKDIKRYLQVSTLSREGLLVVKASFPFAPTRLLSVVPRHVLAGLLTSLHLQLQHPTASQLQKLFGRYFYALDSEREIKSVTDSCAQCAALKHAPRDLPEFSTSTPPRSPGIQFACDILCRARQKILVIRDVFSSFTIAKIISSEQKDSIRSCLLEVTAELKAIQGVTVRVDGASAMKGLVNDHVLQAHGIAVEVGRLKNVNKNPVAEKAILELEYELKRVLPEGGPLSAHTLASAVATLNRRIRNRGLSA